MIGDLLAGLDEEQIRVIGDGSRTIEFSAGATVFAPGDAADCLYIVYTGEVEIKPHPAAADLPGVMLEPGDFFGEIALIEGRSHTSTAITTTPTSILEIRWDTLEQIMDANPRLLRNLTQALAERLRETDRRLMAELSRRAEEKERLLKLASAALSASRSVNDLTAWDDMWQRLLDLALATLNAERGTVYILRPSDGYLIGHVIRGEGLARISLAPGHGLAGACAAAGEALLVPDAQVDPRFAPEFDALTGFVSRAMICSPFRDNGGRILGVIQLINGAPDTFSADQLAPLGLIADQMALSYERAAAVRQAVAAALACNLEDISRSVTKQIQSPPADDPLSGVRRFAERLRVPFAADLSCSPKPVRFKHFIERVVQTVAAALPANPPQLLSDGLYDGFLTADLELLAGALEGLILDATEAEGAPAVVKGIESGDTLAIIVMSGHPNASGGAPEPPLSLRVAQRVAELHRGTVTTETLPGGGAATVIHLSLTG